LKSKNSIDENLVFFIGISKILADYKQVNQTEKIVEKKEIKKEIKKQEKKLVNTLKEEKTEENVEIEDIFDVF
jgi:hypothetical protein